MARPGTEGGGNGEVREPIPIEASGPMPILFTSPDGGPASAADIAEHLARHLSGGGGHGGGDGSELAEFAKKNSRQLIAAVVAILIALAGAWRAMEASVSELQKDKATIKQDLDTHKGTNGHPWMMDKADELDDKLHEIQAEQRVQGQSLDYIKEGIDDIKDGRRRR